MSRTWAAFAGSAVDAYRRRIARPIRRAGSIPTCSSSVIPTTRTAKNTARTWCGSRHAEKGRASMQPSTMRVVGRSLAMLCLGLAACGGGKGDAGKPGDTGEAPVAGANPTCPATAPAPAPLLPRVDAKERTLDYWIGKLSDPDAVVLEPARIRDMNASLAVD